MRSSGPETSGTSVSGRPVPWSPSQEGGPQDPPGGRTAHDGGNNGLTTVVGVYHGCTGRYDAHRPVSPHLYATVPVSSDDASSPDRPLGAFGEPERDPCPPRPPPRDVPEGFGEGRDTPPQGTSSSSRRPTPPTSFPTTGPPRHPTPTVRVRLEFGVATECPVRIGGVT